MRALCINNETKERIKTVISNAESHPCTSDLLKKIIRGDYPPAGDYESQVVLIPVGFRAVYSIEEQPVGWCQHLSVSVDEPSKLPSQPAVCAIMEEFGMGNDLLNCLSVWVDPDTSSINVLQLKDK